MSGHSDEEESDIAAVGRLMDARRKERHAQWKADNLAAIRASNIPHKVTNAGECLLFREKGKPAVDFYPSTGRWRAPKISNRTFGGQAAAFLAWYARQSA